MILFKKRLGACIKLFGYQLSVLIYFKFGDFEIIGVLKEGGRPYDNGGRIDSVVYEATTFALDSARVAGIPVGLATELDTLIGMSSPFMVPVVSLVPEDATEIKDIAPLAEFPRSVWPWIVGVLMVRHVLNSIVVGRNPNRIKTKPITDGIVQCLVAKQRKMTSFVAKHDQAMLTDSD